MKKKGIVKVRGFTLVELIVVIAIIGVLAAILVPSLIGYVRKAQKAADKATSKVIYQDVMVVLAADPGVYTAYGKSYGKNLNWTPMQSFYGKKNHVDWRVTTYTADGSSTSNLCGVGFANGGPGNKRDNWNWAGFYDETQDFCKALNQHETDSTDGNNKKKQPIGRIQCRSSNGKTLNRWFLCYDKNNPDSIQIWVGNGGQGTAGNGEPYYRLYPDPSADY